MIVKRGDGPPQPPYVPDFASTDVFSSLEHFKLKTDFQFFFPSFSGKILIFLNGESKSYWFAIV